MDFPKTREEAVKLHGILSNDIQKFVEFFLKHQITIGIPEFHEEIYKLLPHNDRILLISPRGHGKSYLCSIFYPLWLALFEKRKSITIISASETLAIDWLRNIKRELETNDYILKLFGNLKSDKWTENHIILNNPSRVNIRARGAQGQIRGFRPDVLICDDLETNETVESEEQRKKLRDWIFKDCLNTLLPGGQFIIIGTLIHPLSVLSDLLIQENNWLKKKYRAYIDNIQDEEHVLWKQMWTHAKLQERKHEIGSWAFASEFLNDPVLDESAPIKENQIRFWSELPNQYSCVITVDPAYSDDEKADYKVASLIAIDQKANRYLLNYIRTHDPIGEFQDGILNLWQQNKGTVTSIGIPNSGVEKSFFDSFLKRCDEKKVYPPVVELKNSFTNTTTNISVRNKKSRIISALQGLFEQGKYYIHANHIEAREELLTIGSSRWDDLVDTMAYAEQILQPVFFETEENSEYYTKPKHYSNYGLE